jgi:hypothetical protein
MSSGWGVKLNVFCSTLSFILLSFLLFLNRYKKYNGRNFRRKNFPMEKYTGGRIFRCKDEI